MRHSTFSQGATPFDRDHLGLDTLDRDPFFGRETLFSWLDERFEASQVVWVCGPSGVGKTRGVLEWGLRLCSMSEVEVVFVPAKRASTIDALWAVWAESIGLVVPTPTPAMVLEMSARLFKHRRVVVVLDAVEHLPQDVLAAILDEHLERLDGVVVVITTTEGVTSRDEDMDIHVLAPLPPGDVDAYINYHADDYDQEPMQRWLMPLELNWVRARAQWVGWSRALTQLFDAADDSYRSTLTSFWHGLDDNQRTMLIRLSVFPDGVDTTWLGDLFDPYTVDWSSMLSLFMQRGVLYSRSVGEHRFVDMSESLRQFITQTLDHDSTLTTAEATHGLEQWRVGIVTYIERQCDTWMVVLSRCADVNLMRRLLESRSLFDDLLDDDTLSLRGRAALCALSLAMVRQRSLSFDMDRIQSLLGEGVDTPVMAHFYDTVSEVYRERGDLSEARQLLQTTLESIAVDAPWATAFKTKCHVRLSMVYLLMESIEDAQRHLAHAQEICPPLDSRLMAMCKVQQGRLAFVLGSHDDVLEVLSQALAFARRSDDRLLAVQMLHNLGVLHTDVNELELAMVCLQECLELNDACPVSLQANNFNALGMAYLRAGKVDEAQDAFTHARHAFERSGSYFGMMMASTNLAMVALDAQQPHDAQVHLNQAYLCSQGIDDLYGRLGMTSIHCYALLMLGRTDDAYQMYHTHFATHLDQIQHLNLKLCLFGTALICACCRLERGEAEVAMGHLTALKEEMPLNGHLPVLVDIHALFYRWYMLHDPVAHDPKKRLAAQWTWLQEAQCVDLSLYNKSESIRLISRLVSNELSDSVRPFWSLMCLGSYADHWWLSESCRWVRDPHGVWTDLSRHGLLMAVLRCVGAHDADGGVDVYTLIEQVWPGEHIEPDAATNRLYVAISKLRKRGVGLIINEGGVYKFDPAQPVRWVDAENE